MSIKIELKQLKDIDSRIRIRGVDMPRSSRYFISSIIISIFILMMVIPTGTSFLLREPVIERDPYEQFSTEVLFNRDDITVDAEVLDELRDEGQLEFISVSPPELMTTEVGEEINDTEKDNTFPPGDYYIYGSHLDPRLTVVLSEIDDTPLVEPIIPDLSLNGLSVSIVIPTEMGMVQDEYSRSKLEIDSPLLINDSQAFFMEERGYFTYHLRTHEDGQYGLGFEKDSTQIFLFNRTSNETEWSGFETGIAISMEPGISPDDFDFDIRDLLGFMGLDNRTWTGEYTPYFVDIEAVIRSSQLGTETLNLSEAMKMELRWLSDNDIINGLEDADIEMISGYSVPGNSGINHRIIYHEGSWKSFHEVGEIQDLSSGPEDQMLGTRFKMDYMDRTVPEIEDEEEPPWITTILVAGSITLIILLIVIVMFSYARHERKELLDNLNRRGIFELIKSSPGIHFSEMRRELDLKQGVLSYHINILEKNEFIKSIQDGAYRRFYLYDDKIEFSFKLQDIQKLILKAITETPGITQSKISKLIGRNKMIVNYHMKILLETGILQIEREGRETHCYITESGLSLAEA